MEFGPTYPEKVKKVIRAWTGENSQKMTVINQLNYGWEGWVQADLGYSLAVAANQHGAHLVREPYGYDDLRRADLAIYGNNGTIWHYFELKCKSPNQSRNTFAGGLQADWDKLKSIVVDQNHARLWVLGFWPDDGEGKPTGFNNWDFDTVNGMKILSRTWYPNA